MLSNLKNWVNGYEDDKEWEKYKKYINEAHKLVRKYQMQGKAQNGWLNMISNLELNEIGCLKIKADKGCLNLEIKALKDKMKNIKLDEEQEEYALTYVVAKHIAKTTEGAKLCK